MSDLACAIHGPRAGKLVCRHISAAIRDRVPLPARADTSLDSDIGVRIELTLCGPCLVEHGIPLEPTPIAAEDVDSVERILAVQERVCRKCFTVAERELGTFPR